jgi:type VI secretion system Hcp family effector
MSMFLKISDVEGDSTVKGFEKQIEVNSFSFSSSQATSPIRSNTSHTDGRPSLSLFNFTKGCDKASPILCKKLWSGSTLASAEFTACRDEGEGLIAFLTIKMENVVIANYSVSGGGGVPYENVALNYAKIEINYIPQKNEGGTSGNIPASYDLTTESTTA